MIHTLMTLPYDENAFEPFISKETLQYHHGKHHAGYINNLNNLIFGTEYEEIELTEIIKTANGAIFNNAAQVYNHNFYWMSMTEQKSDISPELQDLVEQCFGTFQAFKELFLQNAVTLFGSGWVWLSINSEP